MAEAFLIDATNKSEKQKMNSLKEKIIFDVSQETFEAVQEYINSMGYESQEGYRIIMGAGLGFLRAQSYSGPSKNTRAESEKNDSLTARLTSAEAKLAAMHYRLFELNESNQNWDLSTGAIMNENKGLKALAERHRREIDQLHDEVQSLKRAIDLLRSRTSSDEKKEKLQIQPQSFWNRWLRHLTRKSAKTE